MPDESKYPTMRYLRCRNCGNVFVESLTGSMECPDCDSGHTDLYKPGRTDGSSDSSQSDGVPR